MTSLSNQELKQAVQTLGLLVRRNFPLGEALKTLGQKDDPWVQVSRQVEKGDSVGKALGRYPHLFSKFFSGMVQAAEESSNGAEILTTLSQWLEASDGVRRKVKQILHYPALMLSFLLMELGLLLSVGLPTVVLPLFYANEGGYVADSTYQALNLAGVLCFVLAAVALFSSWKVEWFFPLALKVPAFRRVTLKADQALWARAVAAFLQGGSPLPEAVEKCYDLVWNKDLRSELQSLAPRLREGDSFSQALAHADLVDPQIRWAVTAGESKEDLSATLLYAAERLEYGLSNQCRAFLVFLQPVAVLLVGLLTAALLVPFWWSFYHYSWNLGLSL